MKPTKKPILIFRHWSSEGPGYLAEVLDRGDFPWRLIAVDAGDAIPETPKNASALVFMGGPMSVNDPLDWVEREVSLIREAITMGIPVLGHCLGSQLIAKAMGGIITKNPAPEIGWLPVTLADNAMTTDWFNGLPSTFEVFHWHSETFSLPLKSTLVLSSRYCDHQGFVAGNTLALQCHIEITENLVQDWASEYSSEIATPSETIQSAAMMMTNLSSRIANLHGVADRIYERWLQPLVTKA
jgi:GMP synthase-like glutamine amidotransferase